MLMKEEKNRANRMLKKNMTEEVCDNFEWNGDCDYKDWAGRKIGCYFKGSKVLNFEEHEGYLRIVME